MNLKLLLRFVVLISFISCKKEDKLVSYSATTSRNVDILNIQRNASETRIDFKFNNVLFLPKGFVLKSEDIVLKNSNDSIEYDLLRVEGVVLDSVYKGATFSNKKYTLVFPSVKKSVQLVDYIDNNTKIFDIELIPQKNKPSLYVDYQGNWLKTDGSNEWIYGIYDDLIIYKNEFFSEFEFVEKSEYDIFKLKQKDEFIEIFIKKAKKGRVLIGENLESLQLYSKQKTIVDDYQPQHDTPIFKEVFKEGVATYKGYLKGYHPRMNLQAKVHVSNVVTGEYSEYIVDIRDDGTFEAKIPLSYSKKVIITIGKIVMESVFLQADKTTVQYIDLLEHNASFKNYEDKNNRKRESLFMGDLSLLNSEMKSLEHISFFNGIKLMDFIGDMTPKEYKNYCLEISKKETEAFNKFISNHNISEESQKIKAMQINQNLHTNILSLEIKKVKAKFLNEIEDRDIKKDIEPELSENYFDFLDFNMINDEKSLITGSQYSILVNRISFGVYFMERRFHNSYQVLKDILNREQIKLLPSERMLLNELIGCKTSDEVKKVKKIRKNTWENFDDKYNHFFHQSMKELFEKISAQKREKFFGIKDGFINDLLVSQSKARFIKDNHKPLKEYMLKEAEEKIVNSNVKNGLIKYNNLKKIELATSLSGKDYTKHEVSSVKSEDLYLHIINQFKGKVVFIDFWATWCGSCLASINHAKPYKEKLKKEPIEFVYITNSTSPIKTYNDAVTNIKGHHYRLNDEQWRHLVKMFNIKAIPHYLFVDKEGNLIDDNLGAPFYNGKFDKLLEKYL